uniref:Uncharacterized protein n=1 Tax=Glossina palpalis gambiensis TaxID=67801 RepID=A0A1B0C4A2_9MUSC
MGRLPASFAGLYLTGANVVAKTEIDLPIISITPLTAGSASLLPLPFGDNLNSLNADSRSLSNGTVWLRNIRQKCNGYASKICSIVTGGLLRINCRISHLCTKQHNGEASKRLAQTLIIPLLCFSSQRGLGRAGYHNGSTMNIFLQNQ